VFDLTLLALSPQLYLRLSDYWTAQNDAKIEDLGITHIVSLVEGGAPAEMYQYTTIFDKYNVDMYIIQHRNLTDVRCRCGVWRE